MGDGLSVANKHDTAGPREELHFDDFNAANEVSLGHQQLLLYQYQYPSRMNTAAMVATVLNLNSMVKIIEFLLPAALLPWCHCACGSQTHGKLCNLFPRRPGWGHLGLRIHIYSH